MDTRKAAESVGIALAILVVMALIAGIIACAILYLPAWVSIALLIVLSIIALSATIYEDISD